ncbi:enoyl-CoA hydratase [Bacillus sp. DTU_2020_1000418_1_SI_GHA_SEK_038]|uniref:enoyl-CoA hydratase n=1 Tax=Bacillus sp. DTU_2020_1000418_1_SI_GHA_SEK_038 TaxID=3077585 RepID=UPI0028ECF6A3|nr:enoyl-CoA hydratase [Bacillus sp. DTU_2020_1000418_1_SI_GHA_SEK_038]WNS76751.1 enoyl-CoA hydratase [Bacillus sp. DTU_2020_1000418_1_SI_GHA_SEK_038]
MTIDFGTETVNLTISGRVATIELNRPDSLNALSVEMLKDLATILNKVNSLDEVDIVVLTGKGRAFCSGGDIKTMLSSTDDSAFPLVMDSIGTVVKELYGMSKLTISAISGAAAGLGLSLALATDYIIAEKSSKLAMNFIGIALIPDGAAHYFLEKRLGEDKAKHLIWEGKPLAADEAYKLGLIHEVTEEEITNTLDKKINTWLRSPIKAMIETKKIFVEKNLPELNKVLELEKAGQYKMRQTEDHKEGIGAFIGKRKPVFIGK